MKKKFFGSLAVLAIAAVAAFNVNVNTQEEGLSDVSLDNVEALAGEKGDGYLYVEPGSPGSGVACVCYKEGQESCC